MKKVTKNFQVFFFTSKLENSKTKAATFFPMTNKKLRVTFTTVKVVT